MRTGSGPKFDYLHEQKLKLVNITFSHDLFPKRDSSDRRFGQLVLVNGWMLGFFHCFKKQPQQQLSKILQLSSLFAICGILSTSYTQNNNIHSVGGFWICKSDDCCIQIQISFRLEAQRLMRASVHMGMHLGAHMRGHCFIFKNTLMEAVY